MPMSYEPDITSLYYDNDKMNRFALPKVTSKTAMEFVWWDETTKFQTGAFSILEPGHSIYIAPNALSVIFVPVVAFIRLHDYVYIYLEQPIGCFSFFIIFSY